MLVAGGNVKLHGASPWPLANRWISLFCSCEHETPQGQPVVSAKASVHHLCFTYFFLAHQGLLEFLLNTVTMDNHETVSPTNDILIVLPPHHHQPIEAELWR